MVFLHTNTIYKPIIKYVLHDADPIKFTRQYQYSTLCDINLALEKCLLTMSYRSFVVSCYHCSTRSDVLVSFVFTESVVLETNRTLKLTEIPIKYFIGLTEYGFIIQ